MWKIKKIKIIFRFLTKWFRLRKKIDFDIKKKMDFFPSVLNICVLCITFDLYERSRVYWFELGFSLNFNIIIALVMMKC